MTTEAQKKAKLRYKAKNPERVLCFKYTRQEADKLENEITASGLSKAEFLRRAISAYKEGKF